MVVAITLFDQWPGHMFKNGLGVGNFKKMLIARSQRR